MARLDLNRRDFVRGTAVAAAAVAAGLKPTYTVYAGNKDSKDTSKIVNYNPEMEYRRCGKTDLMISAVCMGGHWKRINAVIPGLFQGNTATCGGSPCSRTAANTRRRKSKKR